MLMVNFIAFLVSTDAPSVFLTTFVYIMYRHNRSKSVGVNSCNKINFIFEFSSSLAWHWLWGSSFQRETFYTRVNVVLTTLLLQHLLADRLLSYLGCFGRFGLVGYDALKKFVWANNVTLSAIGTRTSTSPEPPPSNSAYFWVISCVSWCCAICDEIKVASLLFFTAVSLFSTRTSTFDTGDRADCALIDGSSILFATTGIVTSTYTFSSTWSDLSHEIDAQYSS
jgi:hypothetical protein